MSAQPDKKTPYVCPPAGASEDEKLRWAETAFDDGVAFMEGQKAWKDIDLLEAVILGENPANKQLSKFVSDVEVERIQRQEEEIVATYSNVRPIAGFETDNREFDEQCRVLDRSTLAWYYNVRADQSIEGALHHAATSQGYLSPYWKADHYGPGEGEICLKVLGPKQVIPYQMPPSNELQDAYAVFVVEDFPVAHVHATWPAYRHKMKARPGVVERAADVVLRSKSPLLRAQERAKKLGMGRNETVSVWYVYVDDREVNRTGKTRKMGKEGTSWYYEVPSVGAPIDTGLKRDTGRVNGQTGERVYEPITRPAKDEDCRLYPQRRLLIVAGGCVVYDGPSYWWHGMVPVVPFHFKKWPTQFLGLSPFKSNLKLQRASTELHRGMVDAVNVSLDQNLAYDENHVAKKDMQVLNLRRGGQRLPVNMQTMAGEKVIQPLVDPSVYEISSAVPSLIESLDARMDHNVALNDTAALMRARQTPGAETMEKAMEMVGPVATARSHAMESSVMTLGRMVGSLILQWYDRKRRMRMFGAAGLTYEDFEELDPDSMVPAKYSEEVLRQNPHLAGASRVVRAKHFQQQLKYRVVHGSLHELTQTSQKLTRLQMQRSGMMISEGTVAKTFGQENYFKYSDDNMAEAEKFREEQIFKAKVMAEAQAAAAEMMPQQQPGGGMQDPAQLMQIIQALVGGTGGNPGVGREPSGQRPAQLVTKSNGDGTTRQTMSESG